MELFLKKQHSKENKTEIKDIRQIQSRLKDLYAGEKENLIMLTCCLCYNYCIDMIACQVILCPIIACKSCLQLKETDI